MSKNKSKWYEPYKIVTALDKSEAVRRIESKTKFLSFKYKRTANDLLFFGGKKYEGEYIVYIWPYNIPPCGDRNFLLPKAIIEIIAGAEGNSIVYIRLIINKIHMIFTVIWCTGVLSQLNVLCYILVLLLAVFLLIKYWGFVRRRVGKLLEELLDVKEEPRA